MYYPFVCKIKEDICVAGDSLRGFYKYDKENDKIIECKGARISMWMMSKSTGFGIVTTCREKNRTSIYF